MPGSQAPHPARRPHHQRQRMPRARGGHDQRVGRPGEARVGGRGEPQVDVGLDHDPLVELGQEPARRRIVAAQAARGVAAERGQARGIGPLPQTSPTTTAQLAAGLEDVVEVAAHLVPVAAGREPRRDVEPLDLRELAGQQALLERPRDAALRSRTGARCRPPGWRGGRAGAPATGCGRRTGARQAHCQRQRPSSRPRVRSGATMTVGESALGAQGGRPLGLVPREGRGGHDLAASQPVDGLDGPEWAKSGSTRSARRARRSSTPTSRPAPRQLPPAAAMPRSARIRSVMSVTNGPTADDLVVVTHRVPAHQPVALLSGVGGGLAADLDLRRSARPSRARGGSTSRSARLGTPGRISAGRRPMWSSCSIPLIWASASLTRT